MVEFRRHLINECQRIPNLKCLWLAHFIWLIVQCVAQVFVNKALHWIVCAKYNNHERASFILTFVQNIRQYYIVWMGHVVVNLFLLGKIPLLGLLKGIQGRRSSSSIYGWWKICYWGFIDSRVFFWLMALWWNWKINSS